MSFSSLGIFLIVWSCIIFVLAIYLVILKFKRDAGYLGLFSDNIEKSFTKINKKVFIENRLFERLAITLNADLGLINNAEKFEAKTRDISPRGVGITSKFFFPAKSHVELILKIPGLENLNAQGMVIWIKKNSENNDFGIKFDKLLTDEMIKIYKYSNNRIQVQ